MPAATQTLDLEAFVRGVPGIYQGVPFDLYLQGNAMHQSTLKKGRDSMKHLKCAIDGTVAVKVTDDMTLGRALHTAFLEPELAATHVIEWTGGTRRGKEWEAFKTDHGDKAILTPAQYASMNGMVAALRDNADIKSWLDKVEDTEVSCIGEVQGVKFKGRCDAMTTAPLWDLKKISKADDRTVDAAIYTYGYHIQGYIYEQLFGRDRFVLGFVEDSEPHDVRPVELSQDWIDLGHEEATMLIQAMKHCEKTGVWPGRAEKIELRYPPDWVRQKFGNREPITLDGESL